MVVVVICVVVAVCNADLCMSTVPAGVGKAGRLSVCPSVGGEGAGSVGPPLCLVLSV